MKNLNELVINANCISVYYLKMFKPMLLGITIFLLLFLSLLAWEGIYMTELKLVEIIPLMGIPVAMFCSTSVLIFLFKFGYTEIYRFNFQQDEATYCKKILFYTLLKKVISFSEIEVIAISSKLFVNKEQCAIHPSLVAFLKNGEEVQITAYLHQNSPQKYEIINTDGKNLAQKIDCKFIPGIPKGKTIRRKVEEQIYYGHVPHQGAEKLYKEENEGITPPTNLNDL